LEADSDSDAYVDPRSQRRQLSELEASRGLSGISEKGALKCGRTVNPPVQNSTKK